MRGRTAQWVLAAAAGCGALLGCREPDLPELEQCGNGIIEPAAGEDCEPVQDAEACGAVGSGALACRWTCAEAGCPDGYACGVDAICRQPCLGREQEPTCSPFEALSTDVTLEDVAAVVLSNVAGDPRREIVAFEAPAAAGDATARVYGFDGDDFVLGEGTVVGARPTLTRLEGGDRHLLAARRALPEAPAQYDATLAEASITSVRDDLGLDAVIVQGPSAVPDGALRLGSYVIPPDVPEVGGQALVFGVRAGDVWQVDEPSVPLQTSGGPADLVGPVSLRPFAAGAAARAGHLASEHCPTLVYGYRGEDVLRSANPCAGAPTGWTEASVVLPALPDDATLGFGIVGADIDGDGRDDLVIDTDAGRVHVAYGVGDGTFHSDAQALPDADGDGGFDLGVGFVQATMADGAAGVIAAGDFNGDGRPDFLTGTTWIRSCSAPGCETCDVPAYRCDVGPGQAPSYVGTAASVADLDGDGAPELAVLATGADANAWGTAAPSPGDLVLVDDPGAPSWSARVVPLRGDAIVRTTGDLDGDGRDDIVLSRHDEEEGDELVVVFGGSDTVRTHADFARIVDAHVAPGTQTLSIVSEELDGVHRRLSRLTATQAQTLRSVEGLRLSVLPRRFVSGHFDEADPDAVGVAVLGEDADGGVSVELLTRGGSTFFDSSTRRAEVTALGLAAEHAEQAGAVAVDLDDDGLDELVVFAPDATVRTLRATGPTPHFGMPRLDVVQETYAADAWPRANADVPRGSAPVLRDLDDDGRDDVWLLSADSAPSLVAFRNAGDGTLDVAGRVVSPVPELQLSVCEDPDCEVVVRTFAAFRGPSDRSATVGERALDVLLVSRRALFAWTLDPLDPDPAEGLAVEELAIVRGGREPLSPAGGQVLGAVGDIDGDGVDDVIAGGRSGLRWLEGLAVNP